MPKSIVDIDVNDEKFSSFYELFEKFRMNIGDIPHEFSKGAKAAQGSLAEYKKQTAMLMAQRELLREQEKIWKRIDGEGKKQVKNEKDRTGALKDAHKQALNLGKSIADTTVNLFKWVGVADIVAGLLGVGSIWGLDVLAGHANDLRRSSMGIGVSPVELQASKATFGPYLENVPATLDAIAAAKADLRQGWAFGAAGIGDYKNRSPSDILPQLLIAAGKAWNQGHQVQQDPMVMAMNALGIDTDTMRRAGAAGGELQTARTTYEKNLQDFGKIITPQALQQWQQFNVTLTMVGMKFEALLWQVLSPLAGAFSDLSKSVFDMIQGLASSGQLKVWIENLASGIKGLGEWLSNPANIQAAEKNFDTFIADFDIFVHNFHQILDQMGLLPTQPGSDADIRRKALDVAGATDPVSRSVAGAAYDMTKGAVEGVSNWLKGPVNSWEGSIVKGVQTAGLPGAGQARPQLNVIEGLMGLPIGLLSAIYKQESASGKRAGYSGSGPDGGALGPFQFEEGAAKTYGVMDRMNFGQEAVGAGKYFRKLLKEFHNDLTEAVAAYNWGEGHIERALKRYGSHWLEHAPAQTKGYVKQVMGNIHVTVNNPAGAQVHVIGSQLPG